MKKQAMFLPVYILLFFCYSLPLIAKNISADFLTGVQTLEEAMEISKAPERSLKKLDESIEILKKISKNNPDGGDVYLAIGIALYHKIPLLSSKLSSSKGTLDTASSNIIKNIKYEMNNYFASAEKSGYQDTELILLYSNIVQNPNKRIVLIGKVFGETPTNTRALISLAISYNELGDCFKAEEYINMTVQHDTSQIDLYLFVAKCYETSGNWRKAIAAYEKIVANNPAKIKFFNLHIQKLQEKINNE